MDLRATARIKVFSRLNPAKDVHTAFSDILSNTDPSQFDNLKNMFLLAIDSAGVEFRILEQELSVLENLTAKWNNEIDECQKEIDSLENESFHLEHEKGEFEQEKLKVDKLKQMKATIATEKPFQKVEATLKIQRENEQKREEIQKVEETNEKRKVGFQQIIEGFEKFLLIEKPPEQKEEGEKEEGEKEEGENEN